MSTTDESRPGDTEAWASADERIAALETQLAEAQSRLLRVHADFQNYQRRSMSNEHEARTQATAGVIQSITPVIDNFELALSQNVATASAEQIIAGLRVIRDELMRVIQGLGVSTIAPQSGDEFRPSFHEAVVQQPSPGVNPGRVVATLQTGYQLGDRVLRPAKVVVAS